MVAWLRAIASFFTTLSALLSWFRELQLRKDAEASVSNDILKKEQENVRKADSIVLEHRNPDSAIERLQSGSF